MVADNREQMMAAFQEARNGKIVVITIHGVPDFKTPVGNNSSRFMPGLRMRVRALLR